MSPLAALNLDPLTLLFSISLSAWLMAAVAWGLSRSPLARGRFGLERWCQAMALGGAALMLLVMRGHVPLALSLLLGNALATAFLALIVVAHAELFAQPPPWRRLLLAAAGGLSGVVAFYAGLLPYTAAVVSISFGLSAELLIGAQVLREEVRGRRNALAHGAVLLLVLGGVAFAVRGVHAGLTADVSLVQLAAGSRPNVGMLALSAMIVLGTSLSFFHMVQLRQAAELAERALHDALTGLYTRGGFFERARGLLAAGPPRDWALMMVDLDHFKRVNDRLGHQGGDRVLAHAARHLGSQMRLGDLAGRYGGEEFCLLLPGCSYADAGALARRLVQGAAGQQVRLADGGAFQYTLSVGYAASAASAPLALEQAIAAADAALYAAKRAGRNRAVGARDPIAQASATAEAACAGDAASAAHAPAPADAATAVAARADWHSQPAAT